MGRRSEQKIEEQQKHEKRHYVLIVTIIIIVCVLSALSGWFLNGLTEHSQASVSLRLNGYKFIDPLLVCNINPLPLYSELGSLSGKIQNIITSHEQAGDISKASTYFVDLANGKWSSTYTNGQYYPSSLGKIPIMIAYYQLAENASSTLDKEITYPLGGADLNAMQDITPEESIVPGQTYTVEQLIEYMIKYSDNNAANLLYENIDQGQLRSVYNNLQIPVNDDATISNLDFITPQQISMMFKVLYNATYLSRDYSEKALQLMSESSFTQGLVAGVASSTVVSHKLGLVVIQSGGVTTEHELHDCGIVYANDPYIMCVMTRGTASLPAMESIIASISQTAYNEVQNGDK
jgi:beta-lactamase class A